MSRGSDSLDLDALQRMALTYPERGATRGRLPSGYRHLHRRQLIGAGSAAFDRAVRTLLRWDMHRRAGLGVTASAAEATPNAVVVLTAGRRPLLLTIPCRVVYTVDEPRRRGFAYGTLPGHPESGEEAFTVELTEAGQVWCDIRTFSRPVWWLARLGGPLTRIAQDVATSGYLRALR